MKRKHAMVCVLALGGLLVSGCGAGGPVGQLTGIWRSSFQDPIAGAASVELILMQDGSFLQQTAYQSGALVTIYGNYEVQPEIGRLRLNIERGEPAQSCGPLGCTNILYPAGETHGYTLQDTNTLILQNVNCAPGQGGACTLTYGRAV